MTFDQQLKEFVETERDNKPAGRRERIATAAPIPADLVRAIYGRDLVCLDDAAALSGFLSAWAKLQVEWADALIAELDQKGGE